MVARCSGLFDPWVTRRDVLRPSCLAPLVAAALLSAAPGGATPAVARLVASPAYKAAVAVPDREHDRIVADIVTLTPSPAPPFKEKARATAYMAMLRDLAAHREHFTL